MKKSFFYSIAAILALAACSKETEKEVEVITGETVTITAAVDQTRSTQDQGTFSWTTDEQISVGTSDNEYVTFDVTDVENGLFSHTFSGATPELLVAVSPAQENAEFAGTDAYEVALPPVYNDYDPSKGVTNALMIGIPDASTPNKFLFRHAAALLKVTYENVPVGTSGFVLNADKPINSGYTNKLTLGGTGLEDIEIANTNSDLASAENPTIINLKDAVTEAKTTLSFYVPVPTGEYSMLRVALVSSATDSEIESSVKTLDRTGKSPLTLARGDVLAFPKITLDEEEPIVENFSSSKASSNNYDCNSSLSTASNLEDFDYTWTLSEGTGTVFQNGIKLGKSGGNGAVTSSDILASIPAMSEFTVNVYAAVWNTDGGQLVVSYNGNSLQAAPANDPITTTTDAEYSESDFASPVSFVFTKSAESEDLTIASSAKRILIDKVEIVLGNHPALVQTLTVTPASDNPETVSHEGGVLSYTVATTNIDSWDVTSSDDAFEVEKVDGGFKVTVVANESTSTRSAVITVTGGTKTVTFTINQEGTSTEAEALTIAQFLAKSVGDTYYRLTGTITNITSTEYGNFDLVDETGTVYVYGLTSTKVTTNDKSFESLGLEEGDIVTLEGKRAVFNNKPQVGGPAYYISCVKVPSLSVNPTTLAFGVEGGTETVVATAKNFTGTVTITAQSDNDQFSATVSGTTITVTADENNDDEVKSGVITVTATNGKDTKTATINVSQAMPAQPAQDGDIIWQEDFTGYSTPMPSSASGSHVFGGETVGYTLTNGTTDTKLYNETLAGGTAPELLIGKAGGSFKISGIPTGKITAMTLTYRINNDNCTITPSNGVTVRSDVTFENKVKTVYLIVPSSVTSFDLEFKNTASGNCRVDNFMLKAGATKMKETQTISFGENKSIEWNIGTDCTLNTAKQGLTVTGAQTTVTYESSNDEVATVDNDGKVTPLKAGTITITATAEETEDYKAATDSYTLRIIDPTVVDPVYAISTINFESELTSYTDWAFENIGNTNTAITAHGGSKYGANLNADGNATKTASIATTSSFAKPYSVKFYISKTSNNSTASNWIIQVSEDGTSWTDVESIDAKSMNKGTWLEETVSLSSYQNVYVRIYYDGTNAARAIDDIELKFQTN